MDTGSHGDDEIPASVGNSTLLTQFAATAIIRSMAYPATVLPRRDEILALLRTGKRLSDIEPIIGVTDSAISAALSDDPEYRDALLQSFRRRLDKAEDGILEAGGKVDVSRASAYHRAIAWRAGVEHPAQWGGAQRIMGADGGAIAVEIVRYSAPLTIDATPVADVPSQQLPVKP